MLRKAINGVALIIQNDLLACFICSVGFGSDNTASIQAKLDPAFPTGH